MLKVDRFIVALVIIMLLAPTHAIVAQDGASDTDHSLVDREYLSLAFEMADQNGDGQVCEAEIVADTASHFATLDSNRDDRLEPEEASQINAETFANLDADSSGALTFMEVVEPRVKMAVDQDGDGDGCWSFEDLMTQTAAICTRLDTGETVEIGPFVSEGTDIRCSE